MSNLLYQLANQYVHFQVAGKTVELPYSMVYQPGEKFDPQRVTRTTLKQHFAAKGSPEQIRQDLEATAQKKAFDLKKATQSEIHQFMIDHGIGIDCSGYVYQVLAGYLKKKHSVELGQLLVVKPGLKDWVDRLFFYQHRVRRCSADTLTSDLNTIEIKKVKDIQPGDMIRLTDPFWSGKHIAVIVDKTDQFITYIHASERTTEVGPHFAKIKIKNAEKGLEHQVWLETLLDGTNYQMHAYQPDHGDSVRRLKYLD